MIRIYTVSDKRPDFIRLQHFGFKKFLIDKEYQLIVCNNGSTPELRKQIESICQELEITSLFVEGEYLNGAIATQVPLIYCLKNYVSKDNKKDITVIIDSDIFLFAPLSFETLLKDADIGGIYQQREVQYKRFFIRNHFYIWNALMIFRNQTVDFDHLDISLIQNVTDVGGRTNTYLRNYKPRVEWLIHTADIEEEEKEIFEESIRKDYEPSFGMQIIENALIHYYRGSNWDSSADEYHKRKTRFLEKFLAFANNEYPLVKDKISYYSSSASHTRKHFNGQRNNAKMFFNITSNNLRFKWIS